MIYPEGIALQTAAVMQAEARGCYPAAAALCTASIIQRMANFIKSETKGGVEGGPCRCHRRLSPLAAAAARNSVRFIAAECKDPVSYFCLPSLPQRGPPSPIDPARLQPRSSSPGTR